jgi:predicted exporter
MGHHPAQNMRRIRRHLLLSLLTTMGVFVAFLFSYVPAYRQLGWLTCLSLILAMVASLYLLPLVVKPGASIVALGQGMPLLRWGRRMVPAVVVAILLFVGAGLIARHVSMDADLSKLDGVSQAVRDNEAAFQHTFNNNQSELAMLVVSGHSLPEAEAHNDAVMKLLQPHFSESELISLTNFWPSAATRQANLARWRVFWTPDRIAALRKNIAAAGQPYGFAADAFEPFFKSLTAEPPTNQSREVLSSIEEQFISHAGGDTQMLSYFQDSEANVTLVRGLIKDLPDAQVVSRRAMGQAFAESAVSETKLLVSISIGFIVISLLSLTRSVVKSILIMLPAATGVVAMLAALSLLHLPMNVVSVIAAVMVMALCSDYGIFAIFSWDEDESIFGHGMMSMHLSSITTLIGTSSLLLAKHPALFMVGVSLTSGLLVGYLSAFFVIPGICYLINLSHKRRSRPQMDTDGHR